MEIVCVTIDCADPARVATFWRDALRWDRLAVAPDGSGAMCGPSTGGEYLEFVRVPEGKVGKNRVHLGCSAGTLGELDDELARLQSLGATIAWEEDFPPEIAAIYRNVILRDVEGTSSASAAARSPGTPEAICTVATRTAPRGGS